MVTAPVALYYLTGGTSNNGNGPCDALFYRYRILLKNVAVLYGDADGINWVEILYYVF